jgi:hypothetical protein
MNRTEISVEFPIIRTCLCCDSTYVTFTRYLSLAQLYRIVLLQHVHVPIVGMVSTVSDVYP